MAQQKLHISDDVALPREAATRTFGILAVRGAGKSNAASVMAEEMFDAQVPFVAIDPVGSWWGLRSSSDGSGAGLPIPIFGGKRGDMPLDRNAGELLAELIVEKRLSCVLDLSGFESEADKKHFLLAFARRLYMKNEDPLHLFLEEADDYIPQKPMRDEAQLLRAWENIVRRGRSRGLGITLITQRSAAINKMVLTQVETLFALRTTGPQDIASIEAWVKYHQVGQEVLASLASLEDGDAWVWSPQFLKTMKRIHFRRRRTFDSGATPKNVTGKSSRPMATLADVDLSALQARMTETIEKAKAEDPRELRRRIQQLEAEVHHAKQQKPADWVSTDEHRKVMAEAQKIAVFLTGLQQYVDVQIRALKQIAEVAAEALKAKRFEIPSSDVERTLSTFSAASVKPANRPAAGAPPRRAHSANSHGGDAGHIKLAGGQRKILTVLAQYPHGKPKVQVAILAGYAHSGGGFNNYIGALRSAGYIAGEPNLLKITDAGVAALGDFEPLPTGIDLQRYWQSQLGGAQLAIFNYLVEHPGPVTKEQLAGATGYQANGGGFNNALGRLRTLELIQGRSQIQAADVLFEEVS